MRVFFARLVCFLTVSMLCCSAASAQAARKHDLVVVLSAGSQYSWAHIGVLEWLEAHRIAPDAVVGTSGGGIVASMYALGYRPAEMKEILKGVPWDRALEPDIAFDDLGIRRKEDRLALDAGPVLALRKSPAIPYGVNTAHYIGLAISRAGLPGSAAASFDDLFVPFRCVSVDVVSGEKVVLDRGSIVQAVRATMAIPVYFTPVSMDRRDLGPTPGDPTDRKSGRGAKMLLTDGGVLDVLALDVAEKEFAPQFLLASDVERSADEGPDSSADPDAAERGVREAPGSLYGVVRGAMGALLIEQEKRNDALMAARTPERGLTLMPNTGSVSRKQYDNVDGFARAGFETMERLYHQGKLDRLMRHAMSPGDWEQWEQRRVRFRAERWQVAPRAVSVRIVSAHRARRGLQMSSDADATRDLRRRMQKYRDRPLFRYPDGPTPELLQLERDLTDAVATGRYDSISYELRRDNGVQTLVVSAVEKPLGTTTVRMATDLSVPATNDVRLSVRGFASDPDIGLLGADMRTRFSFGSQNAIGSEYLVPIGSAGLYVAPRAELSQSIQDVWQGRDRLGDRRVERRMIGMDLGHTLGRSADMRVGYETGSQDAHIRTGPPEVGRYSGPIQALRAGVFVDNQDSAQLPTRGLKLSAVGRYLFVDPSRNRDVPLAEGNLSWFIPQGRRQSFFVVLAGGTTFGHGEEPPVGAFALDGPLRLGAYGRGELLSNSYRYASLGYFRELGRVGFLPGRVRLGAWFDHADLYGGGTSSRSSNSMTGGVVAATPLGTVFGGVSLSDGGRFRGQFTLGRLF